jgi:hypothetical protein
MSSPSSLRVRCPQCHTLLAVPASLSGKTVACPHPGCKKAFTVPPPSVPAQPTAPVAPVAPVAPATPAPRAGARTWVWACGGCLAVGAVLTLGGAAVLVAVMVLTLRNGSSTGPVALRDGGREQPAPEKAAGQDGPSVTEPKERDAPRPAAGSGQPKGGEAPRPPAASGRPATPAPPATPGDDLELPPVGPTKLAAVDTVAVKAKTARAAYLKEVADAATILLNTVRKQEDEIQKSNPKAQEKFADPNNPFRVKVPNEWEKFYKGGGLPTLAAFQPALADYWRAMNAAAQKLGEVAGEGLAAYEKAGVTDPAKLRPLLAMRLASLHPDLLGVWTRMLPNRPDANEQTWVIDFDERTGGFQVEGMDDQTGFQPSAFYHGEKIDFKDGALSFVATPVDRNNGKVGSGGAPTTMTLQDGKLRYETHDGPKPTVAVLERTQKFEKFRTIISCLKKGGNNGLDHSAPDPNGSGQELEKLDVTDANSVWRRLANMSSFAYYNGHGQGPSPGEQLYIPYRSSHLTVTPGAHGGLADMLTGRAPGAGVNQKNTELWLRFYDDLADAPHPYLKRATAQALALSRTRLRLALADEQLGNTPASSIREFQQKVFIPAGLYVFQREADRAALQSSLEKEYPGYRVIVHDAPLSAESEQKLHEFLGGVGGMMEDVQKRAVVSGLLAYADMAQVDQAATFWQKFLLPLARRCGGPAADKPLVAVEGAWRARSLGRDRFQRLDHFGLRNVSGQDLTHAVVEVVAENPWGEKAAHYYYFQQLDVAEVARLVPHPRWDKRRLDFTNTLTVTWSVWADQGSEVGRQVKLTSPAPNPDPVGSRKDYLGFDKQYQAEGEALGAMVQSTIPLPVNPAGQRRVVREAAAPGTSYVFRLPGEGKSGRTLVLRFRRFEEGQGGIEAEVFDPGNRQPYQAQTPVWKGQLLDGRSGPGIVFGTDADWKESGWAFALGQDDRPKIYCPASGKPGAPFPARDIPLFPVKVP